MRLADVRFTYSGNDKSVQLRSDEFEDGRELGYCVLGDGNGGALKFQLDRRLWRRFVAGAPVRFGSQGLCANLLEEPENGFLSVVWALLRAAAASASLNVSLEFSGDEWRAESEMLPDVVVTAPQSTLSQLVSEYPELAWSDAPLGDARELHSFMAEHAGEDGCDPELGCVVALCAYLAGKYALSHTDADMG